MNEDFSFELAREILFNARRIIFVAHPHPDGDTLGSALAMWNVFKSGKVIGESWKGEVDVFCVDRPPVNYDFLPGVKSVVCDRGVFDEVDVICTFDAGDLEFAGIDSEVKLVKKRGVKVINIDHHATNKKFGDVNIVNVNACSTAEVVYGILEEVEKCKSRKVEKVITREVAICLLTGILTDTSGFSNAATTKLSFELAAKLLKMGAKIQDVQKNLVRNMPIGGLRMWGSAMERLKYDDEKCLASTMVCTRDFEKHHLEDEQSEGISNFLARCLIAETVMVLKEHDGIVRGSLRTTGDKDVSVIAKGLGGGGHKKAAGFVLRGKIQEMQTGWGVLR